VLSTGNYERLWTGDCALDWPVLIVLSTGNYERLWTGDCALDWLVLNPGSITGAYSALDR